MVCCLIYLFLDNDVALNFRLELSPRICPYLPVSSQDIKERSQTNDLAYQITRIGSILNDKYINIIRELN